MTIIVLITSGKNQNTADYATVKLFSNLRLAKLFCIYESTGYQGHWVKAEIVPEGSIEELSYPEEN